MFENQSLQPVTYLQLDELKREDIEKTRLGQGIDQLYESLEKKYNVRVMAIVIDEWRSLTEQRNINVPVQFEKALRRRFETCHGKQNARALIMLGKLGLIEFLEAEVSRWSRGHTLSQFRVVIGADYVQLTTLGREFVARCERSRSTPALA